MSYEATKRWVERRLEALEKVTKLPRARCIGMLDAEFSDQAREREQALSELLAAAVAEKQMEET